jgi:hypothetical protein
MFRHLRCTSDPNVGHIIGGQSSTNTAAQQSVDTEICPMHSKVGDGLYGGGGGATPNMALQVNTQTGIKKTNFHSEYVATTMENT